MTVELNIPEWDTVGRMAIVYFEGLLKQKRELEQQLGFVNKELQVCQTALQSKYGTAEAAVEPAAVPASTTGAASLASEPPPQTA